LPLECLVQSESELLAGLKELAADVGADGVAEIVELFLDDSVELLRALRAASERSDGGGIMRAAHALKSTAATLGAADLSALCLEMERLSREGMVREAIPHLPRVEAEYRHVRMLLEGLRGQVETADS
jgi:HPt (histidine-containing phosphotransfer) domain-containing protein